MTQHKIQLPDELDKNQFVTTADLWEHYEDLDSLWNL